MSLFSTRIAAVAAGATLLVGLGSYGAVASGLIDSHDIKNNSITKADIGKGAVGGSEIINGSIGLGDLNTRAQDAIKGAQGEPGPASDVLGKLAVQAQSPQMTSIAKIGGKYADNATDLFTFELPEAGTYLVNAYGYFDRLDAGATGYEKPTTDTYLQLSLRGPEGLQAGTYFTGPVSPAGYTEATASGAQIVTVAAPTTITVRAFGYNEDRSGFGGAPNSATPQFSAAATVSAVRVGSEAPQN
jgi:hypothetical protein